MKYSTSVWTLELCLLAAFGVDIDFCKHCSTDTVFTSAVQGEMLHKRPLARARLPVLIHLDITRVRNLANNLTAFPQPTPESTENAPQHATCSPRRIARYVAISAVQSSPVLTTAAPASAALTTAARTTAAPISTVLTTTSVCGSVVAWPSGSAGNAHALVCRSSPHEGPSNLAPAPLRHALQQASPGGDQLLQQKLL